MDALNGCQGLDAGGWPWLKAWVDAGQERKLVPGSAHSSCTVEMANLNRPVDVAVIDEIQVSCRIWSACVGSNGLLGFARYRSIRVQIYK